MLLVRPVPKTTGGAASATLALRDTAFSPTSKHPASSIFSQQFSRARRRGGQSTIRNPFRLTQTE
jgi:hypothetical protein